MKFIAYLTNSRNFDALHQVLAWGEENGAVHVYHLRKAFHFKPLQEDPQELHKSDDPQGVRYATAKKIHTDAVMTPTNNSQLKHLSHPHRHPQPQTRPSNSALALTLP